MSFLGENLKHMGLGVATSQTTPQFKSLKTPHICVVNTLMTNKPMFSSRNEVLPSPGRKSVFQAGAFPPSTTGRSFPSVRDPPFLLPVSGKRRLF